MHTTKGRKVCLYLGFELEKGQKISSLLTELRAIAVCLDLTRPTYRSLHLGCLVCAVFDVEATMPDET